LTQVIRPVILEPVRWASATPERESSGQGLISLVVGLVRFPSPQIVASRCGAESRVVKEHRRFQSALVILCGCHMRAGIVSADIQTITVEPGGNLISFQLEPADPLLTNVLAPIDGSYDEVWTYHASAFPPWRGNPSSDPEPECAQVLRKSRHATMRERRAWLDAYVRTAYPGRRITLLPHVLQGDSNVKRVSSCLEH